MNNQENTLFQRIGGIRMIQRIVGEFYQTILADDRLNLYYIQNVSDISDLHHKMRDFLAMVLGGPNNYKGKDLKQAHKNMAISTQHFQEVMGHIVKAMKKYKVGQDVIKQIGEIVTSVKGDIITKS